MCYFVRNCMQTYRVCYNCGTQWMCATKLFQETGVNYISILKYIITTSSITITPSAVHIHSDVASLPKHLLLTMMRVHGSADCSVRRSQRGC